MRRLIAAAVAACFALCACLAPVADAVAQNNRATINGSAKITTGLTFQLLLAANARWSVTIQNNNTADVCYLIIGTNQVAPGTTTLATNVTISGNTLTAQQAAIRLPSGISWQRYSPYVPSDAIYVTCDTTGDSVYVDTQ